MPRFRSTADKAQMAEDLLGLPDDERDKLARMHWGQPWQPGVHDPYARQLAQTMDEYCERHELDLETHADVIAKTAVEEIDIA